MRYGSEMPAIPWDMAIVCYYHFFAKNKLVATFLTMYVSALFVLYMIFVALGFRSLLNIFSKYIADLYRSNS